MGDAGLGRIGPRLDVAEEGRRVRPHRWQLASHVAAGPQAVVGRQSFGRVLVARRQLAGLGERFRRFRRAEAARGEERVAVGDVQLRHLLARSGGAACRPLRRRARPVRHGDRLAEMGDRLLEGGAAQGLVAGLAPPFDREIVEAGLREMMGDRFGFGRCAFAQDFGCAAMQRLAAALEQAVVGRVLDQRVLEAIVGLRRSALDEQKVGVGKPIQ